MSAIPVADPTVKNERIMLPGEIGNAANLPTGCCFHPRCKYAQECCKDTCPSLKDMGDGHFVACHFAEKLKLDGIGELKIKK